MPIRHGHRHAGEPGFVPRNARRFASLFDPPSPPALPPSPPPPSGEDPEIEAARRKRRLAEARRRGRRATILTGGSGDGSEAEVDRRRLRTLLGGE